MKMRANTMQTKMRCAIIPETPLGVFWLGFLLTAALGLSTILIIGPLTGWSKGLGGGAMTAIGRSLKTSPAGMALFLSLVALPAFIVRPWFRSCLLR